MLEMEHPLLQELVFLRASAPPRELLFFRCALGKPPLRGRGVGFRYERHFAGYEATCLLFVNAVVLSATVICNAC
jgi:hypothetical protein